MAKSSPTRPSPSTAASSKRRIQVRRSGVHGKGVFAVQDIAEGETIIEYVGEVITWERSEEHTSELQSQR